MATSTFYPDAHPEVSSVDGVVAHQVAAGASWATIRNGVGTDVSDTGIANAIVQITSDDESAKWRFIERGIFLFDLKSGAEALPDGAIISAITLSLYGHFKADPVPWDININIYSSSPASNVALAAGDFDSLGVVPYCDTPISYANWKITTPYWNAFAFNVAGLAAAQSAADGNGILKLGARNAKYDVASLPPTWSVSKNAYISAKMAENGTATRPTLVITYTVPGPISITTLPATDIEMSQATLNGEITDIGGENADYRGFEYGPLPLTSDELVNEGGNILNSYPDIVQLPNGNLIITYGKASTAGGAIASIVRRISTNGGATWSAEATVYTSGTYTNARISAVSLLSDGSIIIIISRAIAGTPVDAIVMKSADGTSWGEPVALTTSFQAGTWEETGRIIELSPNNLLAILEGMQTPTSTNISPHTLKSTDNGATWGSEVTVANGDADGNDYHEAFIVNLGGGNLLALIRNDENQRWLFQVFSTNNGASWGAVSASSLSGTGRASVIKLSDGRLVCVHRAYHATDNLKRYTTYNFSSDNGVTWTPAQRPDDTDGQDDYGGVVETPDGMIACAYSRRSTNNLSSGLFFRYISQWLEAGSFGVAAFDHLLSGLTEAATYYFRATGHNGGGWVRGEELYFPEPTVNGTVETTGSSAIKYDRASLWGNVLTVEDATELGFDYTKDTEAWEDGGSTTFVGHIDPGPFSFDIDGLDYFTSYKFRAKIRAGVGEWSYGATRTLMTSYPVPEVDTEVPSATGDHYIDARGSLVDGGSSAVDCYGFVYGCASHDDTEADIGWMTAPANVGYDAVEQIIGGLTAPLLSANAASGQANVTVESAVGLSAGLQVKLTDNDNEEILTIDHVAGLVVTMTSNLVNSYTTAADAQVRSLVTTKLRNLEYGKRYWYRFWAHNSYGYNYGSEICALTSDTVNLMYPIGILPENKGIRFCIPGRVNFPPTGMYYDTRHHLLVQSAESYYVSPAEGGGTFGWVNGKYVCERQYWSEATNVDLYTMSDPTRRTGTVIKVKYKARIGNNDYGLGAYHKRVISDGTTSLTSAYIGADMGNPGWYCEIFYDNPWTEADWSLEEIDALLMGISIRSGTGWEIPLCDCIEGRVIWANAAVTTKSAMLGSDLAHVKFHGLVTEDETEDCVVYFEYGPTIAYGSVTADQAAVKGQAFSAEVAYTAPAPGTYYHYRTVIETACGETFYGADMLYPNGLILELAFEQSILTVAPTWTDVSTYCLKLHTKRGRLHELDRCEAGVATFILNNAAGDWWRYNAAGAFYGTAGGVKPLTLVRLRYSYSGINHIFYGVAESFKPKWMSESGGFTPVMELNCVDVFKSFTRYKIIDANPALIEDATSGDSHVHVDSTRGLVEGQSIRIYEGDNTQTTTILQIVASLNLVIFDDFLAYDFSTNARLKKFPSVLSGRRMKDIILESRWPAALTAIDDGTVMLVELSPKIGGDNLMEAAFKTMEAECGNLFVAADGKVTFHDAVARTKAPYNESQATFSDDGTHSKYYLPEMSDDDEFIYNECDISGDEIGDQTMLDEDLQLEQGPRSIDKKDSPLADAEDAFDQATISVEKYKLPIPRCVALIVRPDADSEDLWPKVLGYDLGTRITLELNSTRNPACINVPYHIEGVTCDWEASSDLWETKWQLWDVNKYYMFRCQHEGWLRNVWPEPYTYADIHDDTTAAFVYNDEGIEGPGGVMQIGQLPYVAFSYNEDIRRGQLEFDTTDIDLTWTVANAKIIMMLRPQLILYDRIAFDLCVVGTYNSNQPVVLADYGNMLGQTTIYGSIEVPEGFREPDPLHPIGVYMLAVIELSAAGIAHINKGGTSRFWLRSKQDIDAVEPTDGNSEHVLIEGHLGDFAPRLLVQVEKEA